MRRESLRRKYAPLEFSWQPAVGLANLQIMDSYLKNVLGLSGLGLLHLDLGKSAEVAELKPPLPSSDLHEENLQHRESEISFWFVLPRKPEGSDLDFLAKVALAMGEEAWGWIEKGGESGENSNSTDNGHSEKPERWVHLTGELCSTEKSNLYSRHLDELTSGGDPQKQSAKRELWNSLKAWAKN